MPISVHDEESGGFSQLVSLAGAGQIISPAFSPAIPTPFTIAASGNWTSNVLPSNGYKAISVGATSSQTGAIVITRYLDLAGTVQQGSGSSQALTANTAAVNNVYDNLPFASFTIEITNTGGSSATVTNFAVLMNAT